MNNRKKIKEKESAFSSTFVSVLLSFVFLGLSSLLVYNCVKSITTAYRRMELLDQAQEEVSDLRLRNLELEQKRQEILGEDYVEKEARDRLYYVKKGETMVVLPETGDYEEPEDVTEEAEDEGEYGWAVWWEFLKNGV